MDVIYQATDLSGSKRREFLDAARAGRAHLRDTDGTDIVALRARDLDVLEQIAYWSAQHGRIARVVRDGHEPTVEQLGDLAWLRVFDHADMVAFLDELYDCLIAASADRDLAVLQQAVDAWRVTARQLDDPLRRSALLDRFASSNFLDASAP